ncbi:hypothetical protein ACFQ1A_29470, partial [Massilia pinisoli]|uniref:hypothetical protein n=1 Tax=Massilia pinisoli TaxID=1772194 RepID=UPI00362F8DA1
MNKPKDKIEELFQNHLDDFDKMPDDSLWADIEANLPPVATPVYKHWRWGLAAALLLFSLIGYVAYETFNDKPQSGLIGLKENSLKSSTDSQRKINNKGTKTTLEANRIKLTEEEKENEIEALGKAKNDKESVIKNLTPNENIADNS